MKGERIKESVLKRIARSWGFSDIEMENSFDPVVGMLLNAISYELQKVANELEDSKTRVVERVLELLFPEVAVGVKPARAILHALPLDKNSRVSLLNQMSIKKRIHNAYNPLESAYKEIVFSPTLSVKLASCKVKYIAYEKQLFEISNVFYKEKVLEYNQNFLAGEVILGIEILDNEILNLEDLMFYIDIKNTYQKEMFHYYLKQMKCYHDEVEIVIREGYNVASNEIDIARIIKKNYRVLDEIAEEVNAFYFNNFFTLNTPLKYKKITEYNPEEYKVFEEITNNNQNNIIWIKLVFPESLTTQIIENISFTTNCFPVINKKRHTISKALNTFLCYIQLKTEDNIYLDIDTVLDYLGNQYEIKEFEGGALEEGNAALRIGGVSRFDSRSASELLQNVLVLLKDECSSFSGIGSDMIKSSLIEINQLICSIEQQANENNFTKSNDPYLMVRPRGDNINNEPFFIHYWSTCAEEANDIKVGTKLKSGNDLTFVNQEAILMTNTVGGLNKQNNRNRIFAYRDAMLSKGRIVTFADIKAFGFNHFKNAIVEIDIKKGTRKEVSVNAGFSRTMDIYITVNLQEKKFLSEAEWNYLCENFIKQLERKSSNVFPYRLFVRG